MQGETLLEHPEFCRCRRHSKGIRGRLRHGDTSVCYYKNNLLLGLVDNHNVAVGILLNMMTFSENDRVAKTCRRYNFSTFALFYFVYFRTFLLCLLLCLPYYFVYL
jgi:hypothetical protein